MSSGTITFAQGNDDSVVIYLTQVLGTVETALNLTGASSIVMQVVDGETVVDELTLSDGLSVVSATGGSIRAAFTPARTATPGNFGWQIVVEWTNGTGPLTWPLSGSMPRLIIHPAPIPMVP